VDMAVPNIRGVILELYGAGNAPSRKSKLTHFVKAANDAGIVVAVVSQCVRGFVDLEQYGVGKQVSANWKYLCTSSTRARFATQHIKKKSLRVKTIG
jgi:L-asparaginase/Glu-tRNA(Gln) amidotransferase subunit D